MVCYPIIPAMLFHIHQVNFVLHKRIVRLPETLLNFLDEQEQVIEFQIPVALPSMHDPLFRKGPRIISL